jgi:exonuclease III
MHLTAALRRQLGAIATLVFLGAATSAVLETGTARGLATADPEPIRLAVGTLNIEYGGTHVSFDKVVQAVRRGGADVVGVEEAQTHIPRLARELGWPYFSTRLQVVSRLPLIDPPGADGRYLLVEVSPGQVVAIENVHLPSNPYGPFWAKQGRTRAEIVDLERRLRLPAIRPYLDTAGALVEQGVPVFLVGDFNSPSWRDWTPEMVGVRPQIRFPVRWPVSRAVERAGFVDSYRDVHPDPTRDPGLTWWAARPDLPGWNPGRSAPQDRIDLVYAAGEATATESIIVGEHGAPGVDVSVRPWPTDHRGVVSAFSVTPGEMPVLVAVEERLREVGEDVRIRFHAPTTGTERVAIVPAGGDPATDATDERTTDGAMDGTLVVATDGWAAAAYEAVLSNDDGELARIGFWLKEPGSGSVVASERSTYTVGEPIEVSWASAPGQRWDWVGIYRRGRDPHVASYLLWLYTGATIAGEATLDEDANGTWPLEAGRYSAYLLADDGYKLLARVDFEIAA